MQTDAQEVYAAWDALRAMLLTEHGSGNSMHYPIPETGPSKLKGVPRIRIRLNWVERWRKFIF